ncbi:MAG TPA: hypothetical protein PK869_01770 [Candidatus Hydrogenedentes bacterium]|mgnify:FL=1|nr:hypothetical protein [Candidatus Hydrogenedentota bacterium]
MNARQKKLAQRFDGNAESGISPSTTDEQAYIADLQYLRDAARAIPAAPEISDAQFSAFMRGIREGVDATPAPRRGFWAALSLVAAALVVAVSLFVIFETNNIVQPPAVGASVVESASSDISGATVTSGTSEDGSAVVWFEAGQVEMWE